MQIVDVLGYDMRDCSTSHQFSHGVVTIIRLHRVPGAFHLEAAAPAFAARLGRGDKLVEIDRHHLGPDAARRTKVRNAGLRRNSCTGEYHCPPRPAGVMRVRALPDHAVTWLCS